MMTKQPVFPLADTPDADLEQAGGTNVAGGETFATAERIQRGLRRHKLRGTATRSMSPERSRIAASSSMRPHQPTRATRPPTLPRWAE
jgi:hypothetical protein